MVGVAGSNPVVSTKIYATRNEQGMPKNAANSLKHWNLFSLRLEAFSRRPLMDCVCLKKQLRLLFCFLRLKKS